MDRITCRTHGIAWSSIQSAVERIVVGFNDTQGRERAILLVTYPHGHARHPRSDRQYADDSPSTLRPGERRRDLDEARVLQSDRVHEGSNGARDDRRCRARWIARTGRDRCRVHGGIHGAGAGARVRRQGLPVHDRDGRLFYRGTLRLDSCAGCAHRRHSIGSGPSQSHLAGHPEHGRARCRTGDPTRLVRDPPVPRKSMHSSRSTTPRQSR
jgi:hypothetical protein